MRVPVLSPSYNRATAASSHRVFPGLVYAVRESQVESYLAEGLEVLPIPEDQDGNIAKARNFLLREFRGRDFVMVDDDYEGIFRTEKGKEISLGEEQIDLLFLNGFTMADDLGTPLWGINVQADPKFYREYTPFTFLSPVLGTFSGISGSFPEAIRYDEDLWLKEDYDLFLQVCRKFHRVLRFGQYHYRVDHYDLAGGVVGYRNKDEEIRQLRRMQAKWGKEVVRYDLTKSLNPVIRVPLKGV